MQALVWPEHVRPSVCLSHCSIVSKLTNDFFANAEPELLEISGSSKNSNGVTPSEGDLWDWGGYKLTIFELEAIESPAQDRTKFAIDH